MCPSGVSAARPRRTAGNATAPARPAAAPRKRRRVTCVIGDSIMPDGRLSLAGPPPHRVYWSVSSGGSRRGLRPPQVDCPPTPTTGPGLTERPVLLGGHPPAAALGRSLGTTMVTAPGRASTVN